MVQVASAQQRKSLTNYLHDGINVIEELDASGNLLARYAQGGLDEPFAENRSGTTAFYEQDGLGSVTSLSGSAGTISNSYTYDTFGNLVASTGSLGNPFQYTGRDFDPETGLRYYRAKYYDPSIGRFISEDPIKFIAGVNSYSYVDNAPADETDPSGMSQQNPAGPCPATMPRDARQVTVQTLMGEMTGEGEVGTQGWADTDAGPISRLRRRRNVQRPTITDADWIKKRHIWRARCSI